MLIASANNFECIQDVAAAAEFLGIFGGIHTFQTFDDNAQRKDRSLTRVLHGEFLRHAQELIELNERGAGIFFTVSETDGRGRRLENIVRPRALIQDNDENWRGSFPIEPSILVHTSTTQFPKTQAYWLSQDLSSDDFSAIMPRIVKDYGCDRQAKDICRVFRIPGFKHCKRNAQIVRIIGGNGLFYSRQELLQSFPPLPVEKRDESINQREHLLLNGSSSLNENDRIRSALDYIPSQDREIWV
ncbi:MAG: hypothetical protein WBX25_09525 [Rhodomicrobium sp.]